MCKDRFESLLRIDSLKENNAALLVSAATSKSNADSCSLGSSQVIISSSTRTSEDGSSPNQSFTSEVCDENAILKVMVSWACSLHVYVPDDFAAKSRSAAFLLFRILYASNFIYGPWLHMNNVKLFISCLTQEFLALPRADAIHLLAQYNGNAETVIQQIFA